MKNRAISRLTFIFATTIILFIIIIYLVLINALEVNRIREQQSVLFTKIAVLQNLLASSNTIETSSRGYVITQDKNFLTPMDENINILRESLDSLENIGERDNPQYVILDSLINLKIDISLNVIALVNQYGEDEAGNYIAEGEGNRLMLRIRDLIEKVFHDHPDASGIGLYMTKMQIESMGGDIKVQSEVDKGTTFIITL